MQTRTHKNSLVSSAVQPSSAIRYVAASTFRELASRIFFAEAGAASTDDGFFFDERKISENTDDEAKIKSGSPLGRPALARACKCGRHLSPGHAFGWAMLDNGNDEYVIPCRRSP